MGMAQQGQHAEPLDAHVDRPGDRNFDAGENGAQNIALIPNTVFPVSINNVHPQNGPACPPAFEEFYNDNNGTLNQPVYDGFLDVFTASIDVAACEEYTLKVAISDVGDDIFDSAIFFPSVHRQDKILHYFFLHTVIVVPDRDKKETF